MKHSITLSVCDDTPMLEQASVLYTLGSEYKRMAATADTMANTRALDDLAKGFTALAKQREAHTMLHPTVAGSIGCLAYQLMPYGLVPYGLSSTEPDLPAALPGKPPRVAQRVLVVDDTADVLVAVGAFLVGGGFVVLSASDGDTALRLIASDPQIGVLITDYAMPGLSGVALITQAMQMRPNLKALLITGYPNADGLAELPSHINVLAKPFRRVDLIAQVGNLVAEVPATRSDEALVLFQSG